jgi:hypothetical protein
MPPHLLAAISSHGFGHIAQSAPVLNALKRRDPTLQVTVLCSAPYRFLRSHIEFDFEHWAVSTDLGVVNQGAMKVLVAETARAYVEFHADWDDKVTQLAHELTRRSVDLVFADVPYLPLAAAARAGIRSVALCSLNWADILRFYFAEGDPVRALTGTMLDAYASARVFLLPEPSMAMDDLPNTRHIGPIARVGRDRRDELRRALGIRADTRMVLVSLGGIRTDLGMERWPRFRRIAWLVEADWNIRHPDAVAWDPTGFGFIDVLASSDALVTKPGYGSFAEAACNATRVLYLPRTDWPEAQQMVDWLHTQVACAALPQERFFAGTFGAEMQRLLDMPRRRPARPSGIEAAAHAILGDF